MKSTRKMFKRDCGGGNRFPGPLCLLAAIVVALAVGSSKPSLAATGDLDPTFGVGGKVTTDLTGFDDFVGTMMVLQPDGKVVVAGRCGPAGAEDFCLARYNPDGSLDPTFGVGGIVTTDFDGSSDGTSFGDPALVLQADGKLVAAGGCELPSHGPGVTDFCLARYNPDGSLDPTFGVAGRVTTDIVGGGGGPGVNFDIVTALVLQPDDKIVAAGTCDIFFDNLFCLARYNSNGSLDLTFGVGGKVTTNVSGGPDDWALALVLQPDGKLVAAGTCFESTVACLARYNSDGTLDATFGVGGIVLTNISPGFERYFALVLQPDGKLVTAGHCNIGPTSPNVCLARYNPNGSLDGTFGVGGIVSTDFGGTNENGLGLVLQPDGKLLAGGHSNIGAGGTHDYILARYNPDGSLDPTFGVGGKVTTDFAGATDVITELLLQPDGKIVAAGSCEVGATFDFCLARYFGDVITALTVAIDIKPGSFPNSINPRSKGVIPVAILTTDSFDATTVNPTTVLFGVTGTEAAPVHSAPEDVDGDGDADMILHFNTQATGIQCGDTSASLTGQTLSGQAIEGSDSINTVGCK